MENKEKQNHLLHHSKEDNHWQPYSSFVVEFQKRQSHTGEENQTIIHHMESASGETWSGIEVRHLSQWILDHLHTD